MSISQFCKSKNCPEYIEWDFGFGGCASCKLIGEDIDIYKEPQDCLFKREAFMFRNGLSEEDMLNDNTPREI